MADNDDERATTAIANDARTPAGKPAEMPAGAPDDGPTDAAAALAQAAADPAKKSRILYYLVALLVTSVLGPLIFYFGFWRYEPTAQFHVPGGMSVAVRLDARELYVFEPFRRLILPLLDPKTEDRTRPSKLDQLRSETGVDLGNDLREVIIATSDASSWVVLGGGRFLGGPRRGNFLDGYERAMEKEPAFGDWVPMGNVVSGPRGMAVAQAEDGTLILATSVDMAKAALPATDDFQELRLASSGAMSFVIQRAALDHVAAAKRGVMPEAAVLDKLERIAGWVTLGEWESKLSMELVANAEHSSEAVSAESEALFAALQKLAESDPSYATLVPLLATRKLRARADRVTVTASLKGKESEAVMEQLAALIGSPAASPAATPAAPAAVPADPARPLH